MKRSFYFAVVLGVFPWWFGPYYNRRTIPQPAQTQPQPTRTTTHPTRTATQTTQTTPQAAHASSPSSGSPLQNANSIQHQKPTHPETNQTQKLTHSQTASPQKIAHPQITPPDKANRLQTAKSQDTPHPHHGHSELSNTAISVVSHRQHSELSNTPTSVAPVVSGWRDAELLQARTALSGAISTSNIEKAIHLLRAMRPDSDGRIARAIHELEISVHMVEGESFHPRSVREHVEIAIHDINGALSDDEMHEAVRDSDRDTTLEKRNK